MTIELWMLIASVLLCHSLPLVYLVGRVQTPGGMAWALSSRDKPFEFPGWVARAERAHRNLLENLAPFAAVVLIAFVAGKLNDLTAAGAVVFFVGRVLHVATYIADLVPWRTHAFFLAVAGELLILSQLFR